MLDLSIGGPSWAGFSFKKYSNAKELRLFLPASPTHYLVPTKHFLVLSAQDIQENWHAAENHKHCRSQINDLTKLCDGRTAQENRDLKVEINRLLEICDLKQPHFSEDEARKLLDVAALLNREIKYPQKRARPYTAVNNVPVKLTYR